MSIAERHPLRLWLRVLVGLIGLAVATPGVLLVLVQPPGTAWHLDDLFALIPLGLFTAAGMLFLVVSVVGYTPSWLPVHASGSGRALARNWVFAIAVVGAIAGATALQAWLRTHTGLSNRASWILAELPLVVGFVALQRHAAKVKGRRDQNARPSA